jgi:hypothetical protein
MTTDIHARFQPSKQFQLVLRHIDRIREVTMLQFSEIIIFVERNLG